MNRVKMGFHSYGYRCPKCGLEIKRSRKQTNETPEAIGPETIEA